MKFRELQENLTILPLNVRWLADYFYRCQEIRGILIFFLTKPPGDVIIGAIIAFIL
jgi:hypothetical protein